MLGVVGCRQFSVSVRQGLSGTSVVTCGMMGSMVGRALIALMMLSVRRWHRLNPS